MGLNEESRKDIVLYRIERAHIALEQAKGNLQMGFLEVTSNRLYYAAHYAVSALLVAYEITSHSHDGAITQFGLHFVKTGIVSRDMGKLFRQLFTMRQTGDNSDRFDLTEEEVASKVQPTEDFVAFIAKLAKEKIALLC